MNAGPLIEAFAEIASATLREAEALRVEQSTAKALIVAKLTETFPALLGEFQRLSREAHAPAEAPEEEPIRIGDDTDEGGG